ncbi:MAG: PAS domain-containing sensor histidine kinase [Myxococcota bacterium]
MGARTVQSAFWGMAAGFAGALGAWAIELSTGHHGFTLDGLIRAHEANAVLWLTDLSGIGLAVWGALVGRRVERADEMLEAGTRTRLQFEAQEQYREVLETMIDGVVLTRDGHVARVNEAGARIFGLEVDDLVGEPLDRFVPRWQEAQAGTQVVRATARGVLLGMAWLHEARDVNGRPIHVEIASSRLVDDDTVVHVIRDVTEDHVMASRQRRINRTLADERDRASSRDDAKQKFLAELAHDLRTPLASMRGYLEIIQEEVEEEGLDQLFRDLGRVRAATEQVLEVVEKVHDQAMIEAGKLALYLVPVHIEELLEEVIETVAPLVDPNVRLEQSIEPGLPTLRADRRRLRQILLTLVTNAAQVTTTGSIEVRARLVAAGSRGESARIRVDVVDTGPGIPVAQRRTLFSAFQGNRPAAGMGVAISHELAKLMSGDLSVQSEVGQGTTFALQLPVAQDEVRVERLVRTRTQHHTGRAIVVTDDAGFRGLVEAGLGARGVQVMSTSSAADAIDAAESLGPSPVILDISLLRGDPWSELVRFAQRGPFAQTPILGVATRIDETRRGRGIVLPLQGVLALPPDRLRLVERARALGHPNQPIVVFGGGRGTLRPLHDEDWTVIDTADPAEAERALQDAGLLVADLLSDGAAGLSVALSTDRPVLGLLPTASRDQDRAAARRVVAQFLEGDGQSVEAMLDRVTEHLGAAPPMGARFAMPAGY